MKYIIASLSFVVGTTRNTYYFSRKDWERGGVLTLDAFRKVSEFVTATTGIQEPVVNFVDCLNSSFVMKALDVYRPNALIGYSLCTDFESAPQEGWVKEAYEEDTSEELSEENI